MHGVPDAQQTLPHVACPTGHPPEGLGCGEGDGPGPKPPPGEMPGPGGGLGSSSRRARNTESATSKSTKPPATQYVARMRLYGHPQKMPLLTVDATDAYSPPTPPWKLRLYAALGLIVALAALGLYWRLVYCPGPLGHFDWFKCKCSPNSSRVSQKRCTCSQWFNESGSHCEACGDVGQPCCKLGDHCQEAPFFTNHYECMNGTCQDDSQPVPFLS